MRSLCDKIEKGNGYIFKESLQNARSIFRFRAELFEAKINFKQKKEYKQEQYLCDSCETSTDEYSHALYCTAYSDLQNDTDLALYLQKVVQIRAKLRLAR